MNGNHSTTRFHLFRSRAFWFGLPGLVFLLWGWWVSMGHFSRAECGGRFDWWIAQSAGVIVVFWESEGPPDWDRFGVSHRKTNEEGAREWKSWLIEATEKDPSRHMVAIPHRFVVLAYVAGWAGLLTWRKRKYREGPSVHGTSERGS